MKEIAIAHYNLMIEWAGEKDPDEMQSSYIMAQLLGETWYGESCAYCDEYWVEDAEEPCENCPLYENDSCCDGLWFMMGASATWKDWIVAAKKVLKYIKKNG